MLDNPRLAKTCELVGRFLYHFSRVEAQLDDAITALFKLEPNAARIIAANTDFNRKRYIVQSAVDQLLKNQKFPLDAKDVDKTFGRINAVNDARIVVAHSAFDPDPKDGVKFRRTVAKAELKDEDPHWTEQKFEQHFETLEKLESELREIISKLKPEQVIWPSVATTFLLSANPGSYSLMGSPPVLLHSAEVGSK